MKKLLSILILFIILVSNHHGVEPFTLLDYFSGEYVAYSNAPLTDSSINLGFSIMNTGRVPEKSSVIGESMTITNFEPMAALKTLQAKLIKTENLPTGTQVFYAYTDKINSYVSVDGKKVNIQIAYYEDYSVIGWPLILGSF